ncbi:MAG TPA: pyrimidine-specific ribonucleoside hydrolase RihA [Clostridiales bacterium]|nr:pyrimidine-specific ribonucleoside hydrolase RihA [Clostridiales bacterium]
MRIPVIIDCDPGHDDAIALLLAFASDRLEVKAVTVVAGNQTLPKTLNNALRVLSFAGVECEVAAGAAAPLVRPLVTAPQVHGESGLDGPALPEPAFGPSGRPAWEAIIDIVRNSPQKVTLIPVGPLTNIALALLTAPDIKDNLERITLMGGAARGGNWTPAAEFNILVDPEAARVVFESGVPITMVGLDVTHEAQLYPEENEVLRAGGRVGRMVAELVDFYARFHPRFGFKGSPMHDPLAVAAVIDPTLVRTRALRVDIETQGLHTTGQTVVDFFGVTERPPNADVALEVDRERFIRMLIEAIKSYG